MNPYILAVTDGDQFRFMCVECSCYKMLKTGGTVSGITSRGMHIIKHIWSLKPVLKHRVSGYEGTFQCGKIFIPSSL